MIKTSVSILILKDAKKQHIELMSAEVAGNIGSAQSMLKYFTPATLKIRGKSNSDVKEQKDR